MGTIPSDSVAIWLKAPTERSSELPLLQVGQTSQTVAVTVLPLLVFLMLMTRPQRSEPWEKSLPQ